MGYTHGNKWTDDLIKQKILEVVKFNHLTRMPTRSETERYYGDCSLTNAVSRRAGGWYSLAEELELPIKECETTFGKSNEQVVAEKIGALQEYFGNNEERGMAFLYHLTELLRDYDTKINIARYLYLLSRMEPERESSTEVKNAYQKFSEKMYLWSQNPKDRKELLTAIYLYVYLNRKEEEA